MAVIKSVLNTALVLEVSAGVNELGNKIWRKKTFQGVKEAAEPQAIFDVATAINTKLGLEARGFFLSQVVNLTERA